MVLDIFEEGFGRVDISHEPPVSLRAFLLPPARPVILLGGNITALLQEFSGEGFYAWYNRVWAKRPFRLSTRGDVAVLELRIAWQHLIRGKWEKIEAADLPPRYFQLAFTPHVHTQAIFDAAIEYQTFDIHFTLKYLEEFGMDYAMIEKFMNKVLRKEPVELGARPYKCSREMEEMVDMLLRSDYSVAGRKRQLHHLIAAILTEALEIVSVREGLPQTLTEMDRVRLYEVREILEHTPYDEFPGNDVLARKAMLNIWKLSYGFKQLFDTTPEHYFNARKFNAAQARLLAGDTVTQVALDLGYASAANFIAEFKKRFGTTPHQWRLRR